MTHSSASENVAPVGLRWVKSLVAINLAVILIVFIAVADNQRTGLLPAIGYALVFANLTGILGLAVLGRTLQDSASINLLSGPPMAAGLMGTTLLGCFSAQVLMLAAGFLPAGQFWREYLAVLRVALPVTAVFGLGAMFHGSLLRRIRRLEKELHDQEVAAERNRKLAAEARLHSLEARIHPHFLFNTLNSISALIVLDPARAERMMGQLARLLRAALDNSPRTGIALRQELGLVESLLDIERIRFGDKLRAVVSAEEDTLDVHVPPMSVLSLVENAIKHGITPTGGGTVEVIASASGGCLHVEVCDTGPGFDLDAIPSGHGLDSLVARVDAQFGPQAHLNVARRDGYSVVKMVVPCS